MSVSPGYHAPGVEPKDAAGHAIFADIQHAGPWQYYTHPHGGTLAVFAGAEYSHALTAFGDPRPCGDRLFYLPPAKAFTLYDQTRPAARAGCDVTLACGLAVTIPVAAIETRALRIGRGIADDARSGKPVNEYGRLAEYIRNVCTEHQGIPEAELPSLWRLIELAISSRYRVTAEMIDDLSLIADGDVEPLLVAIWTGNVKQLAHSNADGNSSSAPLASAGAL